MPKYAVMRWCVLIAVVFLPRYDVPPADLLEHIKSLKTAVLHAAMHLLRIHARIKKVIQKKEKKRNFVLCDTRKVKSMLESMQIRCLYGYTG